jgi:hypothetical protein
MNHPEIGGLSSSSHCAQTQSWSADQKRFELFCSNSSFQGFKETTAELLCEPTEQGERFVLGDRTRTIP